MGGYSERIYRKIVACEDGYQVVKIIINAISNPISYYEWHVEKISEYLKKGFRLIKKLHFAKKLL